MRCNARSDRDWETKVEQVNEFEAGLGSLPPIVEQVMEELQSGQGVSSGYEGDGYEDYIDYEPQDPIQEIVEQIIETSTESSQPDSDVVLAKDDPIDPYYNPNCFQPPIFSGVPYLKRTLSQSIH